MPAHPRRPALLATLLAAAAAAAVLAALAAGRGGGGDGPRPGAAATAAATAPAARACATRRGTCATAVARAGDPCGCPHPLLGAVPGRVERADGVGAGAPTAPARRRALGAPDDPDPPPGPP